MASLALCYTQPVSLYADSILPRLLDLVMRGRPFRELRSRYLARTSGRVLEIGFGSGLNLPHYPRAVKEVLALEPSAVARKLARRQVLRSPIEVRFVGLRGEEIPLDEASIDTVVSTWTLCTIPGLEQALREIRRVLKPEGRFHFLEHGLAPDPKVARWQQRLNACQMNLCGGCRLDRDIAGSLREEGFAIEGLETFYMRGPRTHAHIFAGIARPG